VDLTVTSGDETFNAVQGTADIQFPDKLPTLSEVSTRLDQIDARIADLQSGADVPTQESVDAAAAAAADASDTANRALLIGAGIGLVGVVIGLVGVILALRSPRRAEG
jgi:hypothetical protein